MRLGKKRKQGFLARHYKGDRICVSRDVVEGLTARCLAEHGELETRAIHVSGDDQWVTVEVVCRLRNGAELTEPNGIQQQIRRSVADATGLNVMDVTLRLEA